MKSSKTENIHSKVAKTSHDKDFYRDKTATKTAQKIVEDAQQKKGQFDKLSFESMIKEHPLFSKLHAVSDSQD